MKDRAAGIWQRFLAVVSVSVTVSLAVSATAHGEDAEKKISLKVLTDEQRTQIEALGHKSIDEQMAIIGKKAKLELLTSGRKGGEHFFDSLGPAKKSLDDITDVEGLYGKAVCPKGGEKPTIYVADDAPPSTLLHEYIHSLQMQNEKKWCELDGKVVEGDEKRERAILYHRFEFDTLKTLWDMKDRLPLNFEDRIILTEGLNREHQTFKALGVTALNEQDQKQIQRGVDDVHAQIDFLSWLTKSPEEAGTVMEKMQVLTLKSCVDQSKGKKVEDKINGCLKKSCAIQGLSCQPATTAELNKAGEDLLAKVIFAWLRPGKTGECPISELRAEMGEKVEEATPCWKLSYGFHKTKKKLSLESLPPVKAVKAFEFPPLPLDEKVAFFRPTTPESFINNVYCYFIFQKVARFESLPIDQFPFAALGASMSLGKASEYDQWLKNNTQGRSCAKLVKNFTGEEPTRLSSLKTRRAYAMVINPLAAITGGLEGYQDALTTDVNHERLHILFAQDKKVQSRARDEWKRLSEDDQNSFKEKHASYDFDDENVLLREYFSYTYQNNPKKLFK